MSTSCGWGTKGQTGHAIGPRNHSSQQFAFVVYSILPNSHRTWKTSGCVCYHAIEITGPYFSCEHGMGALTAELEKQNTFRDREWEMSLYQLPGVGSCLVTDELQKLLCLRVVEAGAAQGGDQSFKRQQ